jgi:hypothetical protein
MDKFLPHVQKAIDKAMKKKTVTERLNYLFSILGEDKVALKRVQDMTVKELADWADFFGLEVKLEAKKKGGNVK